MVSSFRFTKRSIGSIATKVLITSDEKMNGRMLKLSPELAPQLSLALSKSVPAPKRYGVGVVFITWGCGW